MTPSDRIAFIVTRCVAAALAFYATGRHPYNVYILTRWVLFLTCCWGVCVALRSSRRWFTLAYVAIALIFNPILPFHFQRSTWEILDIAAGVVLLVSLAL
jgi:hypothetical protein